MIDIESLLAPVSEESPCGPDLEYDPAFLDLDQAARGKPEQQFGDTVIPAEEPDWGAVRAGAIALLGRTKDLRVAVMLVRSLVRTANFKGFAPGIRLVCDMAQHFWDDVHPQLDREDADDPTMRMNALAPLVDIDVMVRDLRDSFLVDSRQHGRLAIRDVEIALGKLPPREDSEPLAMGAIQSLLLAAVEEDPELVESVKQGIATVGELSTFLSDKVGAGNVPDFSALMDILKSVRQILPAAVQVEGTPVGETVGEQGAPVPISGDIRTRQDALFMIDKIIAYFERNEPTNPAPLLLQRAKRLMNMSFVDIIRDMVPDSMHQIETIAGLGREDS
ncbi:MAG TPA: type VI secretion system protein TssA [Rhodocyclaceae bacterium]|nr:type VI secretion system protein TssA [Rhodocyclaceae bacterium]HMV54152.1 type VI secretion system protein TssA [Rhodocyclaceae bacterium]HNA03691.1 type VI secretion system protein TssA [Rhodocyclaceae bacterium]HNB77500.1 type VI secretion system protein TssA [Rhodocyclaceae bacterium]HNC60005.1 type VI secretion system protein TssA [Rhodocyclaceae bacterium]